MDMRTEVERKLHEIILDWIHFMESPHVTRQQFLQLKGEMRDARVMLENKQVGCITGRHGSECLCAEGLHTTVDGFKDKVRNSARPPLSRGLE